MSQRLYLDPADNFMIRDGRPFNQDDAGRATAASRFPPPPDTVYGAARVALARAKGWDGHSDWTAGEKGEKRKALFGSWNDEESATFKIAGPFFEVNGVALLPFPENAWVRVCKETGEVVGGVTLLFPEDNRRQTDKGPVRMLTLPPRDDKLKDMPLAGRLAPKNAILRLINDRNIATKDCAVTVAPPFEPRKTTSSPGLPGVALSALGVPEHRIGLKRVHETRLAEEGMLYANVRRVLPRNVRMFVEVSGVKLESANVPAHAVPFGGEGRFMFVSGVTDAENMAKKPEKLSARYTATLTTPAILPVAKIGKPFAGLPGTLASMAVSGLSATAGFEKRGTDKCDRVLTKSSLVYPAGSVFFIESGDPKAKPPPAIGTQKHRGYGQYLIGEWK